MAEQINEKKSDTYTEMQTIECFILWKRFQEKFEKVSVEIEHGT